MALLDEKVVIISGAGRGIGSALAKALAAQGARIVITDLEGDSDPATGVVDEIQAAGGEAVAVFGDISEAGAAEIAVEAALDGFGRLDSVINNAGILRDRMLVSMEDDDWDAVTKVHLRGHFLLTRAACRHWREVSKASDGPAGGSVICVTSEAGIYGNVGQANYASSKGGIVSLGLVAAREMGRYGVTANSIAPRARTRMTEGAFGSFGSADGPHPWDPENVAPMVAFLISDAGQAYTGQTFVAGGGVLQVIAPPSVAHELGTGAEPPHHDDIAAFLEESLGSGAEVVAFPDLGLPQATG